MIPITHGERIGVFTGAPTYEVRERVTRLGRHDAYVFPKGGRVVIDTKPLRSVLFP